MTADGVARNGSSETKRTSNVTSKLSHRPTVVEGREGDEDVVNEFVTGPIEGVSSAVKNMGSPQQVSEPPSAVPADAGKGAAGEGKAGVPTVDTSASHKTVDADASPKEKLVAGGDGSVRDFGEAEGSPDQAASGESSSSSSYGPWDADIMNVLNDQVGSRLFKKYCEENGMKHYVAFFFSCKGINDPDNPEEEIAKFVKPLHKRYILSNRLQCLDQDVRTKTEKKLEAFTSTGRLDRDMFNEARNQVVEYMKKTCYPNFLKSDIYISHIQNLQKPEAASEPMPTFASSVPETSATETQPPLRWLPSDQSDCSFASSLDNFAEFGRKTDLATVDENAPLTGGRSRKSGPRLTSDALHKMRITESTQHRLKQAYGEVHPPQTTASYAYHAKQSAFVPTTRRESEAQSQSSGAQGDTTDDAYSSIVDGQPTTTACHESRTQRREKGPKAKPVDRFKQCQSNAPARTKDPKEFAKELHERLLKVQREQEGRKELSSKLQSVEGGHPKGGQASNQRELPVASSRQFKPHYQQPQSYEQESDQSILDDHCSRVFDDTPGRSPSNERADWSANAGCPTWNPGSRKHQTSMVHQHSATSVGSQQLRYPSSYTTLPPQHAAGYQTHHQSGVGDLAYHPRMDTRMQAGSRPMASRSYSDFQASDPVRGSGAMTALSGEYPSRSFHYPTEKNRAVAQWLANTSHSNYPVSGGQSAPSRNAMSLSQQNLGALPGHGNGGGGQQQVAQRRQHLQQHRQQARPDSLQIFYTIPPTTNPYLVRISGKSSITLKEAKEKCPKKGDYLWCRETYFDNQKVLEVLDSDDTVLASEDGKISLALQPK